MFRNLSNYRNLIQWHERDVNELHQAVTEACKLRDRSHQHYEIWRTAGTAFLEYRSPVNDWLDDIEKTDICDRPDARAFIFDYLDVDPMYFRSGYVKEMLARKVKRCDLKEAEREVLRRLIVKRIRKGALREFRRFCQLIPRIANAAFLRELSELSRASDPSVRHRAKFALRYLPSRCGE